MTFGSYKFYVFNVSSSLFVLQKFMFRVSNNFFG